MMKFAKTDHNFLKYKIKNVLKIVLHENENIFRRQYLSL